MPLLIGVNDGIKKGFTKGDLSLINGFPFGMIMMVTGTGKINNVEEFRLRALEANFMNEIIEKDRLRNKLTVEFIQRMKNADWSCNVGNDTKAAFTKEIKRRLYSTHQYAFADWMNNRGRYERSEEE
jgi:hypothetical protein|tara:strand:- start:19062 stop:19442 length:381 start_codon:yes stop_codon:yes gene_type:complete